MGINSYSNAGGGLSGVRPATPAGAPAGAPGAPDAPVEQMAGHAPATIAGDGRNAAASPESGVDEAADWGAAEAHAEPAPAASHFAGMSQAALVKQFDKVEARMEVIKDKLNTMADPDSPAGHALSEELKGHVKQAKALNAELGLGADAGNKPGFVTQRSNEIEGYKQKVGELLANSLFKHEAGVEKAAVALETLTSDLDGPRQLTEKQVKGLLYAVESGLTGARSKVDGEMAVRKAKGHEQDEALKAARDLPVADAAPTADLGPDLAAARSASTGGRLMEFRNAVEGALAKCKSPEDFDTVNRAVRGMLGGAIDKSVVESYIVQSADPTGANDPRPPSHLTLDDHGRPLDVQPGYNRPKEGGIAPGMGINRPRH